MSFNTESVVPSADGRIFSIIIVNNIVVDISLDRLNHHRTEVCIYRQKPHVAMQSDIEEPVNNFLLRDHDNVQ